MDRFGEQGYALIYFAVMGAWGVVCQLHFRPDRKAILTLLQRIMGQLPTWWYRTEYFWIGLTVHITTVLPKLNSTQTTRIGR